MKSYGYAIVSNKIMELRKKVCWMYREFPNDEQDSGWRFFSGEEDQQYTDDPKNFKIYDVKSVLEIDSSIKEFLNELPGVEFERESETSSWQKVNS